MYEILDKNCFSKLLLDNRLVLSFENTVTFKFYLFLFTDCFYSH